MLGRPIYAFVDSDYSAGANDTAGHFTYKIDIPSNFEFDSVALLQASIPKSFYQIYTGRNTLTLNEGATNTTVTITPGNYSITSFRLALITALNAASVTSGKNYTYAITQPNVATSVSTGKYSFTVTGNGGVQPKLIFPSSTQIYQQCGFAWSSTNSFVGSALVSTQVVNFAAITGMVIKSNLVDGVSNTGIHGNSILQEILQFNTFDFSNIQFQNNSPEFTAKKVNKATLPLVTFTICDLDENTLDFNGGSLNFSLVFFQRDTYSELALKDLKMRWFKDLLDQKVPDQIPEKGANPVEKIPAPSNPPEDPTQSMTNENPSASEEIGAARGADHPDPLRNPALGMGQQLVQNPVKVENVGDPEEYKLIASMLGPSVVSEKIVKN